MTEEELRQVDDATLSAISFGLETSKVHYVVFLLFFLFDIVSHMVSNLSFLLQVSTVPQGQSVGDEPRPIDKGKVIRCLVFDKILTHSCKIFVVIKFNYMPSLYIGCVYWR